MRKKILLYYVILIITGMTITGLFVSELAQSLYKNEVKQHLLTMAELFDHELDQVKKSGKPDYDALSKSYTTLLKASPRITVIDYNGKVLGDSQSNYLKMENHSGRKEIQQAVQGKTGEDVRFSTTMKMNFLYIAIPSDYEQVIIRTAVPLVQLDVINRRIWVYCLLGIIAGLVPTTLLALRFASAVISPVRELIQASKEITGGNYSKKVTVKSKDELGELAATFNGMAGKLDRTVADLTDKNIKFDSIMNSMTNCFVAVDSNLRIILINSIACRFFHVTEENAIGHNLIEVIRNRQINEILQQTVKENIPSMNELSMGLPEEGIFRVYASPIRSSSHPESISGGIVTIHDITAIRKLEQIRTDFVSNVTHELKTPLTSIRGFVETLRSGTVEDPAVAEKFLEIIDIEAERLTMLINDILQLSEIENMPVDADITVNSLNGIIEEVVSMLAGSAEKKKVTLIADMVQNIEIKANRNRIKQMFINLIDNAINYNVENGSIRICAVKADGRIVITVADTGIGMEQQHLPRIFERFYRVDKGRSRNMGGTGLGLSIVKHIVNLYDGDIGVESEPGKGTKFTIQLPA